MKSILLPSLPGCPFVLAEKLDGLKRFVSKDIIGLAALVVVCIGKM
jgi:hypothetical protein